MNPDWQNVAALIVVALAAAGLAIRCGLYQRRQKDSKKTNCWACLGCRPPDPADSITPKKL